MRFCCGKKLTCLQDFSGQPLSLSFSNFGNINMKFLEYLTFVYGNLERLKFFWSYLKNKNAPFELGQEGEWYHEHHENCKRPKKDWHHTNPLYFTPLHFVAHQGNAEVADFIINNIESDDPMWSQKYMDVNRGYTPLHVAAYSGQSLECVKVLTKMFNPNPLRIPPFYPHEHHPLPYDEANQKNIVRQGSIFYEIRRQ